MDAELLGFEVASIRDTTGAEEAPEQEPEREREPEPVYDPSKHKSGIVPELQCAGSALCRALGLMRPRRNLVATVNLDCKLDLKTITLHARNAEYNPKACPQAPPPPSAYARSWCAEPRRSVSPPSSCASETRRRRRSSSRPASWCAGSGEGAACAPHPPSPPGLHGREDGGDGVARQP